MSVIATVCAHGVLARRCEVCFAAKLEAELDAALAAAAKAQKELAVAVELVQAQADLIAALRREGTDAAAVDRGAQAMLELLARPERISLTTVAGTPPVFDAMPTAAKDAMRAVVRGVLEAAKGEPAPGSCAGERRCNTVPD